MKRKRPKRIAYDYGTQGKKKLSVPVSTETDARLAKLALDTNRHKSTVVADILSEALQ